MSSDSPLLGTWSLVAWYNETSDGDRLYPLGEDATGFISYSADGFVFVHIMAANRVLYKNNDPFGGSLEEDSAAIKSQITYAGRYDFNNRQVTHHVAQASCPNWVGTQQVRNVKIDGDRLWLSATNARFEGQLVTAYVEWRRALS